MKNLFKTKLLALLLSVAGLFCVSSTYAWTIGAGDVYFDNTVTNWSDVYLRFGASGWCTVYKMTKLDNNSNIFYVNFGGDAGAIDAIQFAAVDGYNVTTGCNTDCGIYNGNVIPNGQKTAYIKADITGGNRLIVATGNTNFCAIEGPFTMPSTVAYTSATLGGKSVTADGTVGYFNPSQNVTFAGTTTLGYGTAPSKDLVHATMNYYLSGSKYSMFSCAGDNSHVKSFSKSVTLPSAVGKYTMSTYYKCGGPASAVRTSYYHIVGLTGQNLNFGAVTAGGSLDKTESLTNVWGGDGVTSVSATISDGTYFQFVDGTTSKSIAITNKAGSVDIRFLAPTGGDWDEKSATLTLTMTCGDGTTVVTKTYDLTGKSRNDGVTIIKSSKATLLPGPKATLHGYIQYTGCIDITERGFYYSTSPNITTSATKVTSSETSVMKSGDQWECGIPSEGNLATNTTYYFRPYVVGSDHETHLSATDYSFTTGDACNYQFGDTVYIQVDKSFTSDDACALKFQELQTALNFVKGNSSLYNSASGQKVLLHNIVFLVAPAKSNYVGTGTTSTTGGGGTDLSTIIFQDINHPDGATPNYSMVIRSSNPAKQPIIQHPTIRNSRRITFDNVFLTGSKTTGATSKQYDNAVDVDENSSDWTGRSVGHVANADIKFLNCNIYSMGFTCVHISAYDGVTFENCDIEADLPEGDAGKGNANTIKWGASAKFIKCKNVKFLRNNFRGSHTTSIWLQGVIGFLAMNNVFWNDNDSYNATYKDNGAFFRLITQASGSGTTADLNQKIGIYYNTLYIADNTKETTARNFDFFRLGSFCDDAQKGNLTQNEYSTIRFMYNNCYSYDQSGVQGANQSGNYKWCLTDTESNWCNSIMYNNYWSMWDGKTANFVTPNTSTCSGNKYYNVNVYEQVCSTAADDPGTLVIKGTGLNVGYHVSSTVDQSGLGAENYYNDRLHPSNGADAVRNKDGNWTLGAYQQSEGDAPIETIVWWGDENGGSDDWDNRNNWRKLDGSRVTCVDNLATDLKVIIPAPESDVYPVPEGGVKKYPFLPTKFSGERTKISQETVNAGHGISNPTMFAGTIELEYGASIKGITALKDDDARRYTEAANYFEAGRSEWILVGTVVKPFTNGSKESARLIQSGDYYLYQLPHVYMHQAEANGENVNWKNPFTQLDEQVPYDKVFSIKLPDQYGPLKQKAKSYYKFRDPSMTGDATVSRTYNFNGWFLNDEVYPEYKVDGNTLLCNTYPANIDIAEAIAANNGAFKVYDYSIKNFVEKGTGEIKSQNGFLFCPTIGVNNGYFRITKDMLLDTNTKYKSATVQNPYFTVLAINTNGDGGSVAVIKYDELKADKYVESVDLLNTVIEDTPTQPEISVAMYGKELDKVVVPDLTKSIPLKLVCGAKMTVEFGKYEMLDIEKATLEDRETGKSYDLLKENPQIALAKGTYEGRFYLNLSEVEEPLPTDVDDVTSGEAVIDIYGTGKSVIITSSENVILKSAEITDMAGRTTYVTLKNPHYNKVNIKGAQGVYIVKAIGDIKSETTKVIVK